MFANLIIFTFAVLKINNNVYIFYSGFSCWLNDGDDQVIMNANKRVEAITGLQMKTAEELQISNYGIGGHYEPHFDFARVSKMFFFLCGCNYTEVETMLNLYPINA